MYLYHATIKDHVKSILQEGLKIGCPSNFDDMYTKDHVFMAFDPQIAIDYVEGSENYDGEDVCVFRIDTKGLDLGFLGYDWNNRCEYEHEINSVAYDKPIPPESLYLMNPQEIEAVDYVEFGDLKHLDDDASLIWERIGAVFDKEVETNKEREWEEDEFNL